MDRAIDKLLAHEADASAGNRQGAAPLHCWAWEGNLEMVALLLDHGADADAKDAAGMTAFAWGGGHKEVRDLLKKHMAEDTGSGGRGGPDGEASVGQPISMSRLLWP